MIESVFEIDRNILFFIQNNLRFEWLTPIMKFITGLGDHGYLWIALCIIMIIVSKTRYMGITSFISLAINYIITNLIIKNAVGRTRPYEVIKGLKLLIEKQDDYSFPSGHSASAFAVVAVMFYLTYIAKIYKDRDEEKFIKILTDVSVICAFIIAYTRLYVAVHYPSDVVAGTVIGIIVGFLTAGVGEKIRRRN